MRRHVLTVLAVSAAMSAASPPANTAAQVRLSVAGGPGFPVGSFASRYDVGWHAQLSAGLSIPVSPVDFRADGAYNRNAGEAAGSFRIISGSLNAIFTIPSPLIVPYLIAGAGIYDIRRSGVPTLTNVESREFGGNLGAGVRVGLPFLSLFGEARLHHLFSDVPRVNFVPVSVGLQF